VGEEGGVLEVREVCGGKGEDVQRRVRMWSASSGGRRERMSELER
jgi:hypothetical protein